MAKASTSEAQFECSADLVTTFSLAQTAPANLPILRTQKIQVGFLRDVDGVVVTDAAIPVTYSGALTVVPDAIGKPCPDLVYPNHQDYGYLLVKLDPRTRANLPTMIGRIEDPFQRVMFWQSFWDNVRFAQLPITDYLDAVLASAATEDDLNNVDQIYSFVGTAIIYLRGMHEKGEVDQDRRWRILRILSKEGHERVDELLAIEKERDPSDDGRRAVIGIEAIRPDIAVKRAIIADILDVESENSYAIQGIAMRSAFPMGQRYLREELADEILERIVLHEKEADPTFYQRAQGFAVYLAPRNCTAASVERLANLVADLKDARPAIWRDITEKHEDDALCVVRAALLP
jgi:aminopeptidase N